jgi:hypothetical protein
MNYRPFMNYRLLTILLLCSLVVFVFAFGGSVGPFVTIFMRTVLDDPNAATARTTLGLGAADSPSFVNLNLTGYGQLPEISTPVTPDPNFLRFYAKDDGAGTSRFYIVDDAGLETDLTGGGGGATTLDALLDVTLSGTPYTDGKVLRANGDDYVDAVLAHSDLSGIGTNAHSVIDSHLASTANPHSVTAAQTGAVALIGNETIAGIKTFSSFPVLPSSSPTTGYQAVHKAYVDAFVQSLEVKLACKIATTTAGTLATSFENGDTIDSVVLVTGDRILIKDQADATANGIYTVNASGAPTRATDYDISSEVQEGTYSFITEGTANNGYQFVQITIDPVLNTNDLVFTYLNKPGSNTASLGVELIGNDLRADLLATGAVGLTGNELKINVDGSSIEIATNALQVKATGITNAMLAGSIADSKLATISTADKVDWTAVNKTGSVLDDIADVVAPAPSDDQALSWDSASSKWIPQTISGGGGAISAAVSDVDVYSSGTTDAKWLKMPAATTELFGDTYSRVKSDLTYATYYRIVVNQTVAGYNTADLNLQYSTDNVNYQAADTAAAGECAVGAGIGVKVGSWAALVAGAQSDVWLRIVGKQGNGTVSPVWRQIRVQFKMLAASGTLHDAVTVVDSQSVNLTLSTQQITADVNDKDYGDVVVSGTGSAWSVDDDSHAHTTTTISGIDISADTNLTAGDGLTLTDDDLDFDGGATPAGDLGGTWADPSVDDDSHAHTTTTISGLDISDDTNFGTAMAAIDLLVASGDGVDANTASVANGDTKHLATGDQIYDFVIGLGYGTGNGDMLKSTYDVSADGHVDGNDVAYGAAWNGDVNAPSMNAVYDKIQALPVGHDAVTVTDSNTIDHTLTGQGIESVVKYQSTQSITLSEDANGLKADLNAIEYAFLNILEQSSDPDKPAEGKAAIWMSDGTKSGDAGDVMIAATANGVTKKGTLWDFNGASMWEGMGNNFSADPNCVALWQCENGALTADSKGANTLTAVNTPVAELVDYKEDSASVNLESLQSQYFTLSQEAMDTGFPGKSGDTNKKLSVSCWFKLESAAGGGSPDYGYRSICGILYANLYSWGVAVSNSTGTNYARFRLGYDNGNSVEEINHTGRVISTGVWYHFGATYQNSNKSYQMRLYDSSNTTSYTQTGTTTNNINIETGGFRIGSAEASVACWDGLLDELVIFNDILTIDEIDQIRAMTYGT